MGTNHPTNNTDPGSIVPSRDFLVQPAKINGKDEIVYAIRYDDGALFFPCVILCNFLPKVNGESIYNKIRKRFKSETRRMVVDDENLVRYRKMVGASRNVVKVFIEPEALLEVAREAGHNVNNLNIEHCGPLLDEHNYIDWLNANPTTISVASNPQDKNKGDQKRTHKRSTVPNGSPIKDELSYGTPGPSAPTTRSAAAGRGTPVPVNASAAGTPAAASASAASSSAYTPSAHHQHHQMHTDTIQSNMPVIGRLVPPANKWPEVFTPHTMEIKVTRSGQKPHFVHWTALNPTDRFLVFKATIESRDQILERKRPWIAKFLSQEFDDEDLAHYEAKLEFPFAEHMRRILATSDLPSDQELAALIETNAFASAVKRVARGESEPAPSKRRRVDPNGTGTAIDPVPEHLQHLTRAIASGDFASAFVHGHNIGADTPAQLPVMSPKDLTNAAFSTNQAVHAIVQSVGSFYYDIKVENQQLHSDNFQLRSEVEQLRHERDGMAAAVMQLQSLVSDLYKRTGGNGSIDFAPVPQIALAPQPAPGSTQADTSAAATAPASPAKSPARSVHSASPARRASVPMVPNEQPIVDHEAQQQVNGSGAGDEQREQEAIESQGDAMDVDPSGESSTNDLSQ